MITHIDPNAIELAPPCVGWSTICLDNKAFITLSYIQDIPDELIDNTRVWMTGKPVTWEIDGEGVIWTVHIDAADGCVKLDSPHGDHIETDVPSKTFLLRLIDEMLKYPYDWGTWRLEYDICDNPIEIEDEALWEKHIEAAAKKLTHDLNEVHDALIHA